MNKAGNYNGYDLMMFPLEKMVLDKYRTTLIARAGGDVLEIGAGSGANLSYYDRNRIRSLTVSDLEPETVLARKTRYFGYSRPVIADISRLPFADSSFDTVVTSLVLCSVPDLGESIHEIQRVLKPGGQYIFIEHVASCNTALRKIQHVVTPAWKRISGNCHLDRDLVRTIREQGFVVDNLKQSKFCLIAGGVGKKTCSSDSHTTLSH